MGFIFLNDDPLKSCEKCINLQVPLCGSTVTHANAQRSSMLYPTKPPIGLKDKTISWMRLFLMLSELWNKDQSDKSEKKITQNKTAEKENHPETQLLSTQ